MKRSRKKLLIVFSVLILGGFISAKLLSNHAVALYHTFESKALYDRHGEVLKITPNSVGLYTVPITEVPLRFEKALLTKEDHYFYYHPGINPLSLIRDFVTALFRRSLSGSSTLTQQLTKTLLRNENNRTLGNKLVESAYALSLEAFTTKKEILTMYANTAYFGRQAQGLGEASRYYFQKEPNDLTEEETQILVATLGNPSVRYPGTAANTEIAHSLGETLNTAPGTTTAAQLDLSPRRSTESFELESLDLNCEKNCTLTIDKKLSESLREIVARNLASPAFASAKNAAVVVLKQPENELIAIVGSPDPTSDQNGYQINMATEPRPIGSTIKPFIYLTAFEKGARPYTLVDDREYTYPIGTGFSLYPKNYDGIYRGLVTLHSALVNSLNVPAVKVLEYITPKALYSLLEGPFMFTAIQPLESYDLGIALGGLEMDLLTLTHYFSIFPNSGKFKPLVIGRSGLPLFVRTPLEKTVPLSTRVAGKEYVELVTKILSDRNTAVDQFGLASNLNLPYKNYALKTGTSRDFHDSWTVGYTPDFVVGVWVGNSENTAMHEVSGQSGAGKIWHEAMQLMYTTEYNKNTAFSFKDISSYPMNGTLEFGLAGDDIDSARNELQKNDTALITNPHAGDRFEYIPGTVIPLRSKQVSEWKINDEFMGRGTEISWKPKGAGTYTIEAKSDQKSEKVTVSLVRP